MYGCKDSDQRLRTETLSLTTAVQSRLGESVHGGGGDVSIDGRPRPHPDLSLGRDLPGPTADTRSANRHGAAVW